MEALLWKTALSVPSSRASFGSVFCILCSANPQTVLMILTAKEAARAFRFQVIQPSRLQKQKWRVNLNKKEKRTTLPVRLLLFTVKPAKSH